MENIETAESCNNSRVTNEPSHQAAVSLFLALQGELRRRAHGIIHFVNSVSLDVRFVAAEQTILEICRSECVRYPTPSDCNDCRSKGEGVDCLFLCPSSNNQCLGFCSELRLLGADYLEWNQQITVCIRSTCRLYDESRTSHASKMMLDLGYRRNDA